MSEKSGFPWFKSREKKKEPEPAGNRESREWEAAEKSALARTMNHLVESLHMALMGGPKGIEMRFQDFTLTQKDLAHLAESLPREDEKTLVFLFKLLNDLDQKIVGENPFYREHYNAPVKAQARAGLQEILSKAVSPESMLPPKPKALEQLKIEDVHWELANKTRDRQLEEGEKKEQEIEARGYRLEHEPVALAWATDIYRYSKLLGQELPTPLTEKEIRFHNSGAYLELEPREEEVEHWEGGEEEPTYKLERIVPNASAGFNYLQKLVDAGVPREKLRTIKDETYEIIEKRLEAKLQSKYNSHLSESQFRMLAAMKKVAPERFDTLKEKFGKKWEEQTLKALPATDDEWFYGEYSMTDGARTMQLLTDMLEVFSDSRDIREAVRQVVKLNDKKDYLRDPNKGAREELERVKNPTEDYDMSRFAHIIEQPLKMAYLTKTLAEKLAE